MGIRSDLQTELKNLLSSDIIKGKVAVQRAYADWRRYPQYIVPLAESSIDMIMAPAYGSSKKNATDIRLAIDALELVFTRPEIGTFILLSGDSDFSSLVIKLKEYGKYVIGVGIRESSSDLLVMNCDEYYSYNALAGLVRTNDEEVVKRDPWELVGEALQRMVKNGDVMRADRLKQVMQDIDGSFDEKDLGMSKFSKFVQEAAQRGLLALNRLENGQYEIAPPGGKAPAVPTGDVAQSLDDAAAAAGEDDDEREGREDRAGRGRRRRGRGRGRDREPRGEREPRQIGEIVAQAAAAGAPAEVAEDATVAVPAPRVDAPRVARGRDSIGLTGERLTRAEAFDLVRRAVSAAVDGDAPASSQAVREKAFELLGRDSESLSERHFVRILQDAHDADLIDLRKRGDAWELAPVQAVAAVADQLAAQEQKHAPPRPTTPAAPRGIVPRGGGGRGGRSAAPLPPELLMVGMVDDEPSPSAAPSAPAAGASGPAGAPALDAASLAEALAEEPTAAEAPSRGGRGGGASRGRGGATAKTAAKKAAARTAARPPAAKRAQKTAAPTPKAKTATKRAAPAKGARK
ncbi:MAG: NYN domain-containing protein [Gemmatimonadaceae bacterium]|nr:NYN domain-containing protein [Gemmatimonadaceae bacterium]